jgi:two-component system chemotaxis response regulator CheY
MLEIDTEQDKQDQADEGQVLQVLVADDSLVYHKLVDDALCYQPYSLLHAKTGQEALELFAKHSPPIGITDWMMPDLTGPELCVQIRKQSQTLYTYVILLTSMSESDSLVKGLEAGADEFLTKPFDPAELQARLGVGRRIVQLHRQVADKNRQIEKSNRIDPLTDLPNHLAIQEWAAWQLKGGAENGYPVWVVLADVDSIEEINEKWGREAGHTVLKDFAQVIKERSRLSDMCGRMSDGKFCLIITHLSNTGIAMAIDRYRCPFAEHQFTIRGKIVTTTASFGANRFDGAPAPDFASLVRDAGKALYAAKQAGGNQSRIVSAHKPTSDLQEDKA